MGVHHIVFILFLFFLPWGGFECEMEENMDALKGKLRAFFEEDGVRARVSLSWKTGSCNLF